MKDTVLESRIRIHLQEFLLNRGFVLASADIADLYVLAGQHRTPFCWM